MDVRYDRDLTPYFDMLRERRNERWAARWGVVMGVLLALLTSLGLAGLLESPRQDGR